MRGGVLQESTMIYKMCHLLRFQFPEHHGGVLYTWSPLILTIILQGRYYAYFKMMTLRLRKEITSDVISLVA